MEKISDYLERILVLPDGLVFYAEKEKSGVSFKSIPVSKSNVEKLEELSKKENFMFFYDTDEWHKWHEENFDLFNLSMKNFLFGNMLSKFED